MVELRLAPQAGGDQQASILLVRPVVVVVLVVERLLCDGGWMKLKFSFWFPLRIV